MKLYLLEKKKRFCLKLLARICAFVGYALGNMKHMPFVTEGKYMLKNNPSVHSITKD